MGQALPKRRTVLIVEDDADLRRLTATLLEDEQLATIECESAEAALAIMLMRGRDIDMIFADVRLRGVMDAIDLAWEGSCAGRFFPWLSPRGCRATASANCHPVWLTCPSRGGRSTC